MVITALDTSFNAVAVVEAYRSFIWTDRYDDVGDFELYVPASAPYLDKIRNDFYLACSETVNGNIQRLMIVEKIEYKTDLEDGNSVLITGRSLESILDRRIIWKDDGSITEINRETIHAKIPSIVYDDYDTSKPFPLQNGIQYLLDMNILNPSNSNRQVSSLTFVNSTDTRITSLEMTPSAYRGDTLYDIIRGLCDMFGISFRIDFDTSSTPKMVFQLYKGLNHLSSQSENGYICFSTEFDNLLSSDNSLDMSTYKTMAYFLGKGEKWSVKEYIKTEQCLTGWIRVYNNALYACKKDMQTSDVPRPDNKVPTNDDEFWVLVTDWDHSTIYQAGAYVTYGIEVYRIDHNIVKYVSGTNYSAGAVVMYNSWMYVSMENNNTNPIPADTNEHWYKCSDEAQCFNAQDWDQVQSVLKDSYDISGDVQNNSTKGLDRRELFVDATNVPSSYTYYPNGQTEMHYILDKGVYEATLRDKALSELTIPGNRPTKNFDCEIETNVSFKYGKDYGIGDVIEVKDTFGFVDSVVVDSYIISHNESGVYSAYPTFEAVESSTIVTKYLTVDMELSTGTFLLKIPENTRFTDKEIIATAENGGTTYYLMSFVKKIQSDSMFSTGRTNREMHMVAWTTDKIVYTDGRYQTDTEAMTVGPAIVGSPLFYINIEGGITLPGIVDPNWLPPIDVNLGVVQSVIESAGQYKNILIANL